MDAQDFEAYAHAKQFNFSIADSWAAGLNDVLEALARPRAEIRLLDFGCGDGKCYRHFLALGLEPENVHGTELSQIRVDRCRALGWSQAVHIRKHERLPYPDEYFDVINLMEVIEHIPGTEIDDVLAELCRVLKPAGVLMGTTPNYPIKRFYDLYDALVKGLWARFKDDPTHVSFYNHAKLRRVLGSHFREVETRCFKTGFLYRRLAHAPFLMHKVLFICGARAVARA